MKVKPDLGKISFLRVLPNNLLVKLDCRGRTHKNYLVMQLDTFLYESIMGYAVQNKLVDTSYSAVDNEGELIKRSTAHYFLLAMINRLIKQGVFAHYGIQVYRNKNKNSNTQLELVTKKGNKINFFYGKRYEIAMTNAVPFTYGLTA